MKKFNDQSVFFLFFFKHNQQSLINLQPYALAA